MPRDAPHIGLSLQPSQGCRESQPPSTAANLPTVLRDLHLRDAVVTLDVDLRITSLNQEAQRLTGCVDTAAAGRKLGEVVRFGEGGPASCPMEMIQRSIEGGDPGKLPPTTVLVDDGVQTPVAVTVSPVKNELGDVMGGVLVLRDITEDLRAKKDRNDLLSALDGLGLGDGAADAVLSGIIRFTGVDCACIRLDRHRICSTGEAGCPDSCEVWDHPQVRSIADGVLSGCIPEGEACTPYGSFLLTDCEGRFSPPIEHRTLALVPIRAGSRTVGLLQLGDGLEDALSEKDLDRLETMARIAGYAFKQLDMERTLRRTEEAHRSLLEYSPDMITIIQDGIIRYCNPRVTEVLGVSPEQITKTQFKQYVHPRHIQRVLSEMESTDEEEVPRTVEALLINRWGRSVPVQMNIGTTDHDGRRACLAIVRDVSHREKAERQLRYHSIHDQLTGLHNRLHFEEALRVVDQGRDFPVSLVVGDLNGLRLTNDAFGHEEGDRLLKRVASILGSSCHRDDVVARIGGDEFAVILPHTSAEGAGRVMDRIRSRCRDGGRSPVDITLSLGSATRESPDEDILNVFRRAEERMYRNKMLELHSVQSALISSLMKTLHEKSLETEEHALRLETMALEVGRRLGLTNSHLDDLALLARLHDIGKITVPDEILFKPGPLTRGEWEEVSKHPEVGFRIAEASPELAPVARAILYHHEWYNGEGYPHGLKGEDIPLISRIISVVDAYDVMTNGRPYRNRMSHREAAAEIKRSAGTQFDPEVADVFLEAFSEPPGWAEEA